MTQPILFLSHGSPMTALGGDPLTRTWSELAAQLARPAAIVTVSAHWTTQLPTLGGSAQPETIHDFGGFPEAPLRQNSCRLLTIGTWGGDKGQKWHGTDRNSWTEQ